MEGVQLELYFGPHLIGKLSDTYYCDFNWYGTLRPTDGMPSRIREFIALCRDWHDRLRTGRSHDAAEFDSWRDVHDSVEWLTVDPAGACKRIAAPVFWPNSDEICWREAVHG